jgi:hypothetical protein
MKPILPALLAAAVLAPAAAAGQMQPVNPPDPHIADGTAQRHLDAAQRSFKRAALVSYRYEIKRSCFCPPLAYQRIVVRAGRPTPRHDTAIGDLVTVPRMFRAIRAAIHDRVHGLRVTYGRYGVPSSISIDPDANIADEESYYTVRRFRRA